MSAKQPRQQAVYDDNPREDVAPFVPLDATSVLEIGCGKGGFGRTLRRLLGEGARIVGVEAVESQAAAAREQHGFDEVVTGYFPDALAGRSERFDLICFNDVLEHIVEPWDVLESVHDLLVPGGRVLAAIPNIQYGPAVLDLLRGRWEYTDSGILDRTHVRFFTKSSIVAMFERCGYRVDQCVGTNSAFDFDWSDARTLKRRLWLRLMPDSEWLHYVVLATSARQLSTTDDPDPRDISGGRTQRS